MRTSSFPLLTIILVILAVAPVMADTLYSNGPYNGTTAAWPIDSAFTVSDSYTLIDGNYVTGMSFVYWDASSSDVLTSVGVALTTDPNPTSGFNFLRHDQHGTEWRKTKPIWLLPVPSNHRRHSRPTAVLTLRDLGLCLHGLRLLDADLLG